MKKYVFTEDYSPFRKGDVIEQDMEMYHGMIHPLLMRGILKRTGRKVNKKKKKKVNMDLDGDGDVDKDDFSIAGRVLAKSKRKKVK